MEQKNSLSGYLAISFSMLFWGISFIWTKQLLNAHFPVFTIVTLRLAIASAIFVTFFSLRHKLERVRKGDWKHFLLLAFYEPFLYFIGEDFGLQYVDASFASVIVGMIPIVVSLTMFFFRNERLSWELLFGTVISMGGIALMTMGASGGFHCSIKGLLFLMVALFAAGGYCLQLVRLLKDYGPITVTTYQNLIAIPFYLPFVLVCDLSAWPSLLWNFQTVGCLCCLAVFCSAGAYMLYSFAAQKVPITKLSVFTNAIPIVTMIVATLIGQENFSLRKFVGIVVVVVGVVISQMKFRKA